MPEPFYFKTEYTLPMLMGLRAKTVNQLFNCLKSIPESCIYYHTHKFQNEHRFLVPEPPNDFAFWLRNIMNLKELGEKVSSINIVEYRDIQDVRNAIIKVIDEYPYKDAYDLRCTPGDEFQFVACKTFILPSQHSAKDLKEFAAVLEKISIQTLYFHIYDSRIRLGNDKNDFAAWFEALGETELARSVASLDPYTATLEGLREELLLLINKYAVNINK